MSSSAFWAGAGGAVLGAIVASIVPVCLNWRSRNRERVGELVAMQEEMRQAKSVMEELLRMDPVRSTAARVPLVMFEKGYPKLIGEGLLLERETSALVEYITRVEALNRALDQAGQASAAHHMSETHSQIGLGMTGAKHILQWEDSHLEGKTIFQVVERTIQRLRIRRNIPCGDTVARVRQALRKLCEWGQSSG